VSLLDDIHGWLPWLVRPLAAIALYLLLASVQLVAVAARERRVQRLRPRRDRPKVITPILRRRCTNRETLSPISADRFFLL
jgi:hypothetical protein